MGMRKSVTKVRAPPQTLRGENSVGVGTIPMEPTVRSVSPCTTTSPGLGPQKPVPMNANVSFLGVILLVNHSIMEKGGGDKSILSDILGHLNHTNTDVETWMEEVKFQFEFEIHFNLDIFFSLFLCIHTGFGITSCLVRANEKFNLTGGCLNILKG